MKYSSLCRGLALFAFVLSAPASSQQSVDPKLQDSWKFMQQAMPGVPYDLLAAACKEGTLTVYSGTWHESAQNAKTHFEKRFPCVNMEQYIIGTGPRRERFLTETRAGKYIVDIVQDTDPGTLNEQADQGLLMNYTISADSLYLPQNKKSGYWYPLRNGVIAIAWNTDNVTEEEAKLLTEWKGLANPKFKGRMSISEPSGGGSAFLPFYVLYHLYGEDFMKAFGASQPRFFANLNQQGAAIASGDLDIGAAMSETPLTVLFASGAPIKWSVPEPGIGSPSGQAISAYAPHPNAAKLYQEYIFSTEEGYAAFHEFAGPPARIGFRDRRAVAAQSWYKYPSKFYEHDFADVTRSKDEIMAKVSKWFNLGR